MTAKYGFIAHLSADFPSQIIVDVTERCNLNCRHCPHQRLVQEGFYSGRDLPMELHEKLIREIQQDGQGICKFIRYTGEGETLLHPEIVTMVRQAKSVPDLSVNVTTNGMLLDLNMIKALIEAKLDVIDISIDAYTKATYEQIRRGGDFDLVTANVRQAIGLTRGGAGRVVVSFVKQDLNAAEADEFKSYWESQGVDYVVIRGVHTVAGSIDDLGMAHSLKHRRPCIYPWERMVLGPEGLLRFCPAVGQHQAVAGQLGYHTIKELWQSEFMQKLRQAHQSNDYSAYALCGNCPDWEGTRWPHEGRAYSDLMNDMTETSS